jgi:predicted RecA/RadA family phage recombinase
MPLTADLELEMRNPGEPRSITMAASQTIYKGSLVSTNAAGYAVPGTDTASEICVGIAVAKATSGTTAGVDRVDVYMSGCFKLVGTSLEAADTMKLLYISDNGVVIDGAATNDIPVGIMIEMISATSAWVEIGARVPGVASTA